MPNSDRYLFIYIRATRRVSPFSFLSTTLSQCLATIASIYWKTNEESVEGEKAVRTPISAPIESRSVPPSSSKADRVQGLLRRKIFLWELQPVRSRRLES